MAKSRNFYADLRTYDCTICGTSKPMRFNGKNLFCSPECRGVGFKGFKFTDESRAKMSASMKGLRRSPSTEIKKGQHLAPNTEYKEADKNLNWKGGTSFLRQSYGNSKYMIWRIAVLNRDNFTCQHCGWQDTKNETDHIKQWAKYPDLRFDINNGQTLCKTCHKRKTSQQARKIQYKEIDT